jgi:hypothetical protein
LRIGRRKGRTYGVERASRLNRLVELKGKEMVTAAGTTKFNTLSGCLDDTSTIW